MKLSETKLQREYLITRIMAKPPLNYRLLSMGFAHGSRITLLAATLANGTLDVCVDGIVVALRKEEAEVILVELCA